MFLLNYGMKNYMLIFIALFISISCNTKSQEIKKPNIILILSDDQGWGDLSSNGNKNLNTPNIDHLANEGVTFDHFYVQAVCSPTRAEILTGRYHVRAGVYSTSQGGERIDLDETTIAEVFKAAGYSTAAYGKWHSGMQPPYHPNARGFEDYYGFCSGHWGNYFDPMLEHNGEIVKGNGFLTDDLTSHGLNFIETHKDKPFFLYLPYNTPHSPMQVPDEYWNRFKDKELKMYNRDPEKEDTLFTKAALAMVENIDWNVGRVTEKIKELGLDENTIIIYLSDNGPNSVRWNGGMKGKKGSTDEGGVRSPMIIKWKGKFEEGKNIQEIAGAIDFLPTLTDLAQIDNTSEKEMDGVSLAPLLLGNNSIWEERLIFNYWNEQTSVRSQKFRLDNEGNLFNMESDPGQELIVNDKFSEEAIKLQNARLNWIKKVRSELIIDEERPITIGHPDYVYNQIPARDGKATGSIQRSNRHPNCTFFTNWVNVEDEIYWDAEVLEDGDFDVEIYYTCKQGDEGSSFLLSFGNNILESKIKNAHDPALKGASEDRYPRQESYVKDFKSLNMGTIHLEKGRNKLTLKAIDIIGSQLMDFRLLMLKRKV